MRFLLAMIRARRAVLVLAGLWALGGLWVALRTPIDALPDLSENQVLVYTPWPGHHPPEIQAAITRPLSESLQGIPGVVTARGSSDVGLSLLHLIFDDSVRFHEARRRVDQRLRELRVELPRGVAPQLAPEGIPTGQIVWYTLSGRETDLLELRRWQGEVVAPQLQKLPGVAEVATVGGFQGELCVTADTSALARAGVSIADLELQLRNWSPRSSNA
ncbi:MAG: efflux RND transporter permease subunit, partial [Aureliella sp.]